VIEKKEELKDNKKNDASVFDVFSSIKMWKKKEVAWTQIRIFGLFGNWGNCSAKSELE